MRRFFLILVLIIFYGCTVKHTPLPEERSEGAKLFREKCSLCHPAPHPKRNTFKQWQHMLSLMDRRMAERGIKPLTVQEREVILNYLKNHSR